MPRPKPPVNKKKPLGRPIWGVKKATLSQKKK
jgi:hypothetical protein